MNEKINQEKRIREIGFRLLEDLIDCYYGNIPFYANQINKYLREEDVFITDEDLFCYIANHLSESYQLDIKPAERIFDDLIVIDTELKLIKKQLND